MTSKVTESEQSCNNKEVLALEAPPTTRDSNSPIQLNVTTSEPVSLYNQLGPTIVASDGTLSRIGNWGEMDELERGRVLRVLGARNKIRLEERQAFIASEEEKNQPVLTTREA